MIKARTDDKENVLIDLDGWQTEICYHCGAIQGYTTLQSCMKLCPKYSGCGTAAIANDNLVEAEGGGDQ